MNNFIKRAITGIIFVAVIVGSILWSPYSFALLFGIITILACREFYNLMNEHQQAGVNGIVNCIGAIILFFTVFFYQIRMVSINIILVYLIYLIFLFISGLYMKRDNVLKSWAYALFGQVYIALPFSLLSVISISQVSIFGIEITQRPEYSPFILLALFVFIWVNDTGAYLVGSQIGKHRLFERISPKKSWEGFFGGVIFAMIAGFLFSFILTDYNAIECIGMGFIVSIFATWGDLTESLIKRTIGVTDSGTIIQGHGGILDRFDSILLAAPAYLIYLTFLELF